MSITGSMTASISNVGTPVTKTVQITAGGTVVISEDIPANQSALALTCAIDISVMKMFYMVADVNLTAQFFNGVTGHESFTLLADQPVTWNSLQPGVTCPLTAADTTSVKITNTTAGTFDLRVLQDVTP